MSNERVKCPNCGSDQVGGLVAAFWYPVSEDLNEARLMGETEMGHERLCFACDHEFDADDLQPLETKTAKKSRKGKR